MRENWFVGVTADKRQGQESLKFWKKAKCLINDDKINLDIFRKKNTIDCRGQQSL